MARLKAYVDLEESFDQIAEILFSDNFLVEIEKIREEVVDAKYTLIKKTDNETVFEIATTGYKHNKKGEMDKSGTNTNIAEYRWDRKNQTISVDYKGSGRIIISGTYHLQPEQGGTRLSFESSIEVKIPVIGMLIASKIKKSMQQSFDTIASKIAEDIS